MSSECLPDSQAGFEFINSVIMIQDPINDSRRLLAILKDGACLLDPPPL